LQRRVPKFGFNNINRKDYQVVNLDKLQALVDSAKITDSANLDTFVANGISATTDLVKVTGRGELKAKLTITAHKFTASAKQAIIAAGGEAIEL
jgi:large subunit ribosomal protein L15